MSQDFYDGYRLGTLVTIALVSLLFFLAKAII